MENEIMETNELENTEVIEDYESECTGGGLGKLVAGIGVVAVAGLAAFAYKNKAKLEERKIERLRKKGYVIYRAEEVAEVRDVEDSDLFEDEETTE